MTTVDTCRFCGHNDHDDDPCPACIPLSGNCDGGYNTRVSDEDVPEGHGPSTARTDSVATLDDTRPIPLDTPEDRANAEATERLLVDASNGSPGWLVEALGLDGQIDRLNTAMDLWDEAHPED